MTYEQATGDVRTRVIASASHSYKNESGCECTATFETIQKERRISTVRYKYQLNMEVKAPPASTTTDKITDAVTSIGSDLILGPFDGLIGALRAVTEEPGEFRIFTPYWQNMGEAGSTWKAEGDPETKVSVKCKDPAGAE